MSKPFNLFRIIRLPDGKAFVSGSRMPSYRHTPQWGRFPRVGQTEWEWFDRGNWSSSGGVFFKTEQAVRGHLQNLCHDWETASEELDWRYQRYSGERRYFQRRISKAADWTRLAVLQVEQLHVAEHSTAHLSARDFMGIQGDAQVAA